MTYLRPIVCLASLSIILGSSLAQAEEPLDWTPKRTWVFVAGLLEWEHPEYWSPFPAAKKNRRDEQLVKYFSNAGVPQGQIIYLQDSAATKKRIEQEFKKLLDRTQEGDLLVFYFCGHGYRDRESGQTWFANYDAASKSNSAWGVPSVFSMIESHFNGDRVLLLADCCHSGALYDLALKHKDSDVSYAVITSSYSHNSSTGNWTFSDSVLSALRGDPNVDLNGDKIITLKEMGEYCELELAFVEGQKSMYRGSTGFPLTTRLATVQRDKKAGEGARVEVEYKQKWYKAKILETNGHQSKVHYTNYDDSWDEWVGPERIRPYAPHQFASGDKVQILWSNDKKWYPGTVLKAWYGLHLIHYEGYDATWDEWVHPGAVRLR
ncbi:MAG: Tudor-knot domain-containing protein [Planctomycetales bacterium]